MKKMEKLVRIINRADDIARLALPYFLTVLYTGLAVAIVTAFYQHW